MYKRNTMYKFLSDEEKENTSLREKKRIIASACRLPEEMIDDLEGTDYSSIRTDALRKARELGLGGGVTIFSDGDVRRMIAPDMNNLLERLAREVRSDDQEDRGVNSEGYQSLAERLGLIK